MNQGETSAAAFSCRSRQSRLLVLGLIQTALGLAGMVMIGTTFLGPLMMFAREGLKYDHPTFHTIFSFGMCLCASVYLLVLGIGSGSGRRWARALSIVVGWTLSIASLTIVVIVIRLYPLLEAMQHNDLPPDSAERIFRMLVSVMVSLSLGIPLLLVLVYSGKRVRTTCEYLAPDPCWTNRLPMSVLFLACLMVSSGMWTFSWLKPVQLSFHEIPISMLAKNIGVLLLVFAYFLSAWGLFRLKLWGWRVGLLLQPLDLVLLTLLESTGVLALLGIPGSFAPYATLVTPAVMLGSLTNIAIIFVVFFVARRHFTHAKCAPEAQDALPSPTGV